MRYETEKLTGCNKFLSGPLPWGSQLKMMYQSPPHPHIQSTTSHGDYLPPPHSNRAQQSTFSRKYLENTPYESRTEREIYLDCVPQRDDRFQETNYKKTLINVYPSTVIMIRKIVPMRVTNNPDYPFTEK